MTYYRSVYNVRYVSVYYYNGVEPPFHAVVEGSIEQGFSLRPTRQKDLVTRLNAARDASRRPTVEIPAVAGGESEGLLLRRATFGINLGITLFLSSYQNSPHRYGYDTDQAELDYALGARSEPRHITEFWKEREARDAQRQVEQTAQRARDAEIQGLSIPRLGASFSE